MKPLTGQLGQTLQSHRLLKLMCRPRYNLELLGCAHVPEGVLVEVDAFLIIAANDQEHWGSYRGQGHSLYIFNKMWGIKGG